MRDESAEKMSVYSQEDEQNNSMGANNKALEEEQEEAGDSDIIDFEIMNYPADTTLKGYKEQWDNKQLKIPSFQRKYIWKQPRASRLIESFLIGLTVPGVFLYKKHNSHEYLVIDGQQRIHTIVSFFKGVFGNKKFTLRGVHKKWEGKAFEDLTDEDKFKLETTVMRATIIQQLSPKDNSSIYHIFERLNTGGVNLSPMEVRMCVSEGAFVDMLIDLNKSPEWRKLFGKKEEDDRSKDKELILRILALHDTEANYTSSMKRFLNQYLDKNKNASKDLISSKKDLFLKAIKKADHLPKKPFHLVGRLNFSLMESVFVALMMSPLSDAEEIYNAYKKLKDNEKYLHSVKQGKNSTKEISERLQIARDIFNYG